MSGDENTTFDLPWSDFRDDDVFEGVDSISGFSLNVSLPRLVAWGDADHMISYQDTLYEGVYELLERSGLLRLEELTRTQNATGIGVAYGDPDYEFDIHLTNQAQLRINRRGSSLKLFYDWYRRVMPGIAAVVTAVQDQLGKTSGRGQEPRNVRPVRAWYTFSFILHDFTRGPAGRAKPVKNAHVLRTSLTHVPGATGDLVELSEDELPDLGRINLSVSRRHSSPSGVVREIYKVEAPANRDYSTVWLEFSYIAETLTDSEQREHPNFALFLERYDYPLLEFVRERALCKFVGNITTGLNFRSTPGQMP